LLISRLSTSKYQLLVDLGLVNVFSASGRIADICCSPSASRNEFHDPFEMIRGRKLDGPGVSVDIGSMVGVLVWVGIGVPVKSGAGERDGG
jgi:hypothetical protein